MLLLEYFHHSKMTSHEMLPRGSVALTLDPDSTAKVKRTFPQWGEGIGQEHKVVKFSKPTEAHNYKACKIP